MQAPKRNARRDIYAAGQSSEATNTANKDWAYIAGIFIMIVAMGFPGNMTTVFGNAIGKVIDYGSVLLTVAAMLLSSAKNTRDMVVVEFSEACRSIYLMLFTLVITSLFIARSFLTEVPTCVRLIITVFYALWIAKRYSIHEMLEMIYIAQVIFIALNLIYVYLFPSFVYIQYENYTNDFVGILGTKNGLGSEMAFALVMQVLLLNDYRKTGKKIRITFIAFFVLQIYLLINTENVASFFVVIIPIIYIIFWEYTNGQSARLHLGIFYIAVSVGFMVIAMTILPLFSSILDVLDKDMTLTGRTPLWEQCLNMMKGKYLFFGYGYGNFWRDQSAVSMLHNAFAKNSYLGTMEDGSHNVLIELLINNGIVGITVFFVALLDSMKHIYDMSKEQYLFCTCFLMVFMIYGFSERAWATHDYMTLFLFYTMAVACNRSTKTTSKPLVSRLKRSALSGKDAEPPADDKRKL